MKLWLVRIDGDAFDLEQLTKLYHTPKYSIYKEQDYFYLNLQTLTNVPRMSLC